MCRILYTLEHSDVAAKSKAAGWAKATLGGIWDDLIAAALAWLSGEQADRLEETASKETALKCELCL